MKAIILAGGNGSRLYPLTQISSKQLQAVYDKPMIYYPLTVLMSSGIREFCLISTPHDLPRFENLLGDGSQWGISIEYRMQPRPEGIAQALLIADDFIAGDNVVLMLGDNIFFGGDAFPRAVAEFQSGATIFAYHVKDPERYGVVEFDADNLALSIEEKPQTPRSSFAVPGIYLYDGGVVEIARRLQPSARGELEITDVNRAYLAAGSLRVRRLSRGFVWLDAGTSSALQEASSYVETIERRQGVKLGCPEEAALVRGFLSLGAFKDLVERMPDCEYRHYLEGVAREAERHKWYPEKAARHG
jgi:glucose-1-phosphate thymidylyltransferase